MATDYKSLFSILDPKEQEQKIKIPYRAPSEISSYELAKPLKPGEKKIVTPVKKTEGVDTKALVEKIGGKDKVIKEDFTFNKPINVPPSEPQIPDYEPVKTEATPPPPPKPDLEVKIKETTKDLPHVEAKQVRNAEVMKEQQDTTSRELASDSSAWDEIWPALIPIATNALIGNDTTDVAFDQAAKTLEKIQDDKKYWAKANKTSSKAAGTDQMALERLKQEGRLELEGLKGGNRGTLEEIKAELGTGKMLATEGTKAGYKKGQKEFELGQRSVDVLVKNPDTGKMESKKISMKDYTTDENGMTIPVEKRLPLAKGMGQGSSRLIAERVVKDNITTMRYRDPISGEVVKEEVMASGKTSPYFEGASLEQTKVLDPMVKEFRKEATTQIENQKDFMKIMRMIESPNVYENTQAIFGIIKKIEGRMTDEDAQRYTAPLDYWGQLLSEYRKKGFGKYPNDLINGFRNVTLKSLENLRSSFKQLPNKYTDYARNVTGSLNIPDEKLQGVFSLPSMQDEDFLKWEKENEGRRTRAAEKAALEKEARGEK